MENLDPGTRRRLRQAQDTAQKNKRSAAEQLFRELLADRPDIADAWYGLGTVLADEAEQKAAYSQALELSPGHAEASRALAILRGEIPPDVVEPVDESDEDAPSGLPDAPRPEELADVRSWSGPATVSERFDAIEAVPEKAATPAADPAQPAAAENLVCYKHGNPTNLRCYSCGKPICGKCSKVTPVGYRCLDCIRDAESVFFDANPIHYLVSMVTAGFLGAAAAFLMSVIGGLWFLAFFLGPAAGTFIGNLAFRLNGRHRGRYLPYLVAGALLISGLPFLLLRGNLIGVGIYLFMAVPACYYQLR
ncbi:MAG: hypothetical protein KDE59_05040 [Anaerolineales bacterium]|nr:hypothetical protein [Anaerolineales bacterium]MCB0012791.1 hypothetical protein [Anaerolineales bacterium]